MPAAAAARSRSICSRSAAAPPGPARPAAASCGDAGPGSPSSTRAGASPAPTGWSPRTAAARTSAPCANAPNASPRAATDRARRSVELGVGLGSRGGDPAEDHLLGAVAGRDVGALAQQHELLAAGLAGEHQQAALVLHVDRRPDRALGDRV